MLDSLTEAYLECVVQDTDEDVCDYSHKALTEFGLKAVRESWGIGDV